MVNADLAENVAGLRVTQAFRREGENRARFAGRSFAYRQSRLRAQRYIALYFPFVQTLSTVASALVLVVAVGQVRSGALRVGALIAYLLYIDMVFSPIQQLSQVFDGYQQAAVGVSRIKDLMRLRTSVPEPKSPVPVPAAGLDRADRAARRAVQLRGRAVAVGSSMPPTLPRRRRRPARRSPGCRSRSRRARPSRWWGRPARASPRSSS